MTPNQIRDQIEHQEALARFGGEQPKGRPKDKPSDIPVLCGLYSKRNSTGIEGHHDTMKIRTNLRYWK